MVDDKNHQAAPADQPEPTETAPAPPDPQLGVERSPDMVEWTASEFVSHDKTAGWYALLAVGAVALAALMYLINRDWVSVAVALIGALMLGVYANHKPRQLDYRLDRHGVQIGPKVYSLSDFRSFSVLPEGAFASIIFMPLKRFAPPLTIYYAPEDEDKILSILSEQLPYEQRRRDAVDSLMRRIRF